MDFSTLQGAFSVVNCHRDGETPFIRVLLRPGRYVIREAITVQNSRNMRVEIETMEMPDSFLPIDQAVVVPEPESARKRKPSQSLRNILSCRTVDVEQQEDDFSGIEFFDPSMLKSSSGTRPSISPGKKRATIVLRTRRHNEPIIYIRQGTAVLRNLELKHVCHGSGTSYLYRDAVHT